MLLDISNNLAYGISVAHIQCVTKSYWWRHFGAGIRFPLTMQIRFWFIQLCNLKARQCMARLFYCLFKRISSHLSFSSLTKLSLVALFKSLSTDPIIYYKFVNFYNIFSYWDISINFFKSSNTAHYDVNTTIKEIW